MPQTPLNCPAITGAAVRWPSFMEAPGGWVLSVSVFLALVVAVPVLLRRKPAGWSRLATGVCSVVGSIFLLGGVALSALIGPALSQDVERAAHAYVSSALAPGASLQAVLNCAAADLQARQDAASALQQVAAACFGMAVLFGVACLRPVLPRTVHGQAVRDAPRAHL